MDIKDSKKLLRKTLKKNASSLFVQIRSSTRYVEIFSKTNGFRDYLTFHDFRVVKIVFHNKIIKIAQKTKNQENSARFGGK